MVPIREPQGSYLGPSAKVPVVLVSVLIEVWLSSGTKGALTPKLLFRHIKVCLVQKVPEDPLEPDK